MGATVDIIPQKEITAIRRITASFEDSEKAINVAMDVTNDSDRRWKFEKNGFVREERINGIAEIEKIVAGNKVFKGMGSTDSTA
jgi:hypothetical protein